MVFIQYCVASDQSNGFTLNVSRLLTKMEAAANRKIALIDPNDAIKVDTPMHDKSPLRNILNSILPLQFN